MFEPLTEAVIGRIRSCRVGALPPKKKAATIIEYGRDNSIRTLVETGTYLGQTVQACLGHFERIFTVELDASLCEAARKRFAGRPEVTVIEGDSHEELARLVADIDGRALFWLDAHYSEGITAKGTHDPPLEWELEAILSRNERDVVLLDDARLMGVAPGYPSIDEIRRIVSVRARTFEVLRDIVRINLAES